MAEQRKEQKGMRKQDFVLIGVILVIAIVAAVASQLLSGKRATELDGGPYVVVQSPKGTVYSEPLSKNAEFTVTSDLGENQIKVQDNMVWVEKADCKNQVCVNTGKVHNIGEMIVCLPHKVLIQVVEKPEDAAKMNVIKAADEQGVE